VSLITKTQDEVRAPLTLLRSLIVNERVCDVALTILVNE
jgi:hypothetical protein